MQARANGELSHQLDNGPQAALISFASGLFFVTLYTALRSNVRAGIRRLAASVKRREIPKWRLFAGMLGGSFVAIQSSIVPLIGVAVYSVAAIAGQTAVSLIVDRIGLTGGGPKAISPRRVSAALITIAAVLVSVWDQLQGVEFSHLAVFLAFVAGSLVGVQRALNGQINEFSGDSFATTFLNFVMGTTFLALFLAATIVFAGNELQALPTGPWWIYTGGIIGVIYIATTSLIVQHLGVLTFTLVSVGGNLFGSLLLDIYLPTEGTSVSWYLVTGIAMTYIGVVVGGARQSRRARM
jgi:transporter family-2 protein